MNRTPEETIEECLKIRPQFLGAVLKQVYLSGIGQVPRLVADCGCFHAINGQKSKAYRSFTRLCDQHYREAVEAEEAEQQRLNSLEFYYVAAVRDGHPHGTCTVWPARDEDHANQIRYKLLSLRPVRQGCNGPIDNVKIGSQKGPLKREWGETLCTSEDVEKLLATN